MYKKGILNVLYMMIMMSYNITAYSEGYKKDDERWSEWESEKEREGYNATTADDVVEKRWISNCESNSKR